MTKKNLVVVFIIIGVILTYIFHRDRFLVPVEKTEILMDTVVSVKIYGKDKNYLEDLIDNTFRVIRTLSIKINNYDKRGEIYKINYYAGIKPVKVDKVVIDFLKRSINLCKATGNYLDISIGTVLKLWGFATQHPNLPEKNQILNAIKLKGLDLIKIDEKNSTVFIVKKGISIDVGAVAKGYIIDKGIEYLKSKNIKKGVINAGGDIRFIGFKENKKVMWNVGIRNPFSENPSDIIKQLKVGNWAIVTSGDYERYFIKNGKKYHHIINPFTGYPARKVHSVTVCAENAFIADGLATAIFVMGKDLFLKDFYPKFKKISDFRAIIIVSENKIFDTGYKTK
jgi:thiamine biosynthesis lipoprotein